VNEDPRRRKPDPKFDVSTSSVSRREHVTALRTFLAQARHDIDSFPQNVKTAVTAVMEQERLKHQRELTKLQTQIEDLKRVNTHLSEEVSNVKAGLRKAIKTLKERDKLISQLNPT